MKKAHIALALFVWLTLPAAGFCGAPHQLAGFVLGDPFSDYRDRVDLQTKMPLRHSKSIEAIEVQGVPGFKYGLVWVGTCLAPKRIVSIRMKYADSSKEFYDELFKRFQDRFGKPSEWRGDPFHIVISWKWSFIDEQKNRVSVILSHNKQDEDQSIGNTIKMTMWNLIEEERNCHHKRSPEPNDASSDAKKEPLDWDLLIPR
jgi:hypothetical protein